MASLDVDSLFTIIPLDETIETCFKELFKDKNISNGLDKCQLKELLTVATKQSFFIFDNIFYSQKDGVSMGSPLGPTLANTVLCYYEKQWLHECLPDYKRYVDDIVVLFENNDQIEKFQQYLNIKHINVFYF